tara:strand:+ start:664 stop:1350 length:687 start_codon:yes stop_codon:yes gene_type:complete
MEILFVRHGQPAWSVEGLSQDDPGLTPTGHKQAIQVAQRLIADRVEIAEILVSPSRRTRETAVPLSEATGIPGQIVKDILEIQMPSWNGRPEEEVQKIFAEARSRPPGEWWEGLEGGESFKDFNDRVISAMKKILAERSVVPDSSDDHCLWQIGEDSPRIVVIAHGGTNAAAISWLLGIEPTPWEWERFILAHGSISRVRTVSIAGSHIFSLRTFNDQEHLAVDIRTR